MGGGDLGALAVLAGEVGQLIELLDEAAITVTGLLTRRASPRRSAPAMTPGGTASANANSSTGARRRPGIAPHTATPTARDEHWGHLAIDGALHCTLWVAEWPRIDVRALFLQPLLMDTRATRSVAMVMELVGPAARPVTPSAPRPRPPPSRACAPGSGSAPASASTTRQRRHQRERELAEGHAAVRYAAYVTVSVPTGRPTRSTSSRAAVSRVELEAKRAPLRLERMWGQQAEAFTYSLPLGRGLDERPC